MLTILTLNGLQVVIYPADHRPAHVHMQGAGFEIVFDLNCPNGPLDVRNIKGKVSNASIRRVAKLIVPSLSNLCGAWRDIHGNYKNESIAAARKTEEVIGPCAVAARYRRSIAKIEVDFDNGVTLVVPVALIQGLGASDVDLNSDRDFPDGLGLALS